ncbi:hypothetical protein F4X90_11080 [Candidatus Poribacteria bacterium]|nr:hypothetical protein [Candidatus Poribacteria bacterium]
MPRLRFMCVVCLIGIAVSLPLITLIPCIAEEDAGILSGVILDMNGKPIPGFIVVLSASPFLSAFPIEKLNLEKLKTDENGAFTFTNVPAEPIQILIPVQPPRGNKKPTSRFEPDDEIVSIKIEGITLYQDRPPPFDNIRFSIKPGSHIKNVVVTVRPRVRIIARVVFKDGKPLTNTSIVRVIKTGGMSSGGVTTDAEGYFVQYIDNFDVFSTCELSVRYKGLSAKSEPFEIKEGMRYDNLILTLDGVAPPAAAPTQSTPAPKKKYAWVVNPTNGHAYTEVWCRTLDEAKDIATAAGAYLVTINDKAEQEWLSGLFRNHLYWIGLSDAEKEGEWVWQNGEPLTYENWGAKHSFPRSTLSPEKKDSAIMTFVNGQWHAVGPGDLLWRMTEMVILEKEPLRTGEATEAK